MIRWNKWTRDYTYTYELVGNGVWTLIHKKSNRPVVHWVKSWYNTVKGLGLLSYNLKE